MLVMNLAETANILLSETFTESTVPWAGEVL
jgi:hypothetical protein